MTTPKIQHHLAALLMELHHLGYAMAAARTDGPAVMDSLHSGRVRVVIDEAQGFLTIGTVPESGGPVQWLETVECTPRDEQRFGHLASVALGAATTH